MSALLGPQELRERLVQLYTTTYQRAFGRADQQEIEAKVIADLELVDAARRNGELCGPGRIAAPGDRPASARPDLLAAVQAETGTTLTKPTERRAGIPYRPRVLHENPMVTSARWGAAVARIARITEGAGGASTFERATANAEIPALARRYAETFAFFLTRSKPPPPGGKVDHNKFRNLSDKDAARLFMREVEDICDKSTGVLGAWYVK